MLWNVIEQKKCIFDLPIISRLGFRKKRIIRMSLLGNILWIFLGGGIILFFEYFFAGLLLCITIIGIPFGIQCMKLSLLALLPFGKEIRQTKRASGCLSTVMNLIWILVGGIWISLTHLIFAVICAITIIGIPFARQHIKLAALSLVPFGKEVV
jgi:uncharacterized membrane protein YccF (DUF307 family)